MAAWLRNLVFTLIAISVGLAIWKVYGGNLGGFFDMIYGFFYTIVDAASNVIVQAWKAINGGK